MAFDKKAYDAARYAAHREERKVLDKARRQTPEYKAYMKAYRAAHHEAIWWNINIRWGLIFWFNRLILGRPANASHGHDPEKSRARIRRHAARYAKTAGGKVVSARSAAKYLASAHGAAKAAAWRQNNSGDFRGRLKQLRHKRRLRNAATV